MIRREIRCVPSPLISATHSAIREGVRAAELNLRGWPVLSLHRGDHEKNFKEGIQCYYKSKHSDEMFFWRISTQGLLYHCETMDDYDRQQQHKLFDPVLRILEFAEVFAVIPRFYEEMLPDANGHIDFEFSWTGILDRYVAYNGNHFAVKDAVYFGRKVAFDDPSFKIRIPWSPSQGQIISKVIEATNLLFDPLVTNFKLEDAAIGQWAEKCLTRTIS